MARLYPINNGAKARSPEYIGRVPPAFGLPAYGVLLQKAGFLEPLRWTSQPLGADSDRVSNGAAYTTVGTPSPSGLNALLYNTH